MPNNTQSVSEEMQESYTLDSPVEYRVKEPETVTEARIRALRSPSVTRRIKALEQQAAGHENIARGIRGEIAELKREAGIDKNAV